MLERSASASSGVDVLTSLLSDHGQGGPCAEGEEDFTYHNSFLLADSEEAWVVETAGEFWAAERAESESCSFFKMFQTHIWRAR